MATRKAADAVDASADESEDTSFPVSVIHESTAEEMKRNNREVPEGVRVLSEDEYVRVAQAGGFFNPKAEPTNYRPTLQIKGIKASLRDDVRKALAKREE